MVNFLSNRSLAGMKAESIEEPRQRPRKTRGFEGNVPLIQNIKVFLAVQNSSIGDLVTNSLTEGHFDFDITE